MFLVNFLSLNYNGSWEGFFRWSALYGVSDSFVGYPYGSVYFTVRTSFLPLNCNKDKDKDLYYEVPS